MCEGIIKYHSRSFDFVLAFAQVKLKEDMYMEIAADVEYPNSNRKQYVLKIDKSYID